MKNKILVSLIGALLAFSSFLMGHLGATPANPLGGVAQGSEYHSTSTDTQVNFANYTVANRTPSNYPSNPTSTPGTLGSVIITTTGTSPMCLRDATSTNTNAEWATSTIVCFGASPTVGTYAFDTIVSKGILVEFTGSPTATSRASTTITFR